MMAQDDMPLLPGFLPAPRQAPRIAPEARGKIGQKALAFGVGTKADDEVPGDDDRWENVPRDRLVTLPEKLGEGWTPDVVAAKMLLVERVAATGDFTLANRWIINMDRPKSALFSLEAVTRMVAVIERQAAARDAVLVPVEPDVLYTRLDEIPALEAGRTDSIALMPAEIASLVVESINDRLRALARAGFRSREDRGLHSAPMHIQENSWAISCLSGASVRVINQIALLVKVSRVGQTAHEPMTLDRRLMLIDSALAQLAEDVGVATWTAASLGLVTDAIRAAWHDRAAHEPLAAKVARNLFDWSKPGQRANPLGLGDADLLRLIQEDQDMEYVDLLRAERARRSAT